MKISAVVQGDGSESEKREEKIMNKNNNPFTVKPAVQNTHKPSWLRLFLLGGLLLGSVAQPVRAETITIGKGTGIVWEGLPFNVTLTGPMYNGSLFVFYAMAAISSSNTACLRVGDLRVVDGYNGLLITSDVVLVPRAVIAAQYRLSDGTDEQLTGTIGLPDTSGMGGSTPVVSSASREWCLNPRDATQSDFYDPDFTRTVNFSGTWVMVANGQQKNAEVTVPSMYAASFSYRFQTGSLYSPILPSNITLRISTLECAISTPTEINFGTVERNTTVNSELALLTNPLTVTCSQGMDDASTRINANINVQFHPISGLFEGESHRLALTQGGGYITGEIDNAVTGSGACNLNSGVAFDGTQIKVGAISETESNKVLSNQVTWRLCSGGASLPVGPVTAAADMIVTFN